jgi:5-methylcytosine-specific restriction endonuclease McrA
VFARDGWLCHICGGRTDKARRGTYHPNAPELDHIVPLAKGGAHSYANTACAHRKCNAAKSDTIMGQPSLLAA